jgi:hypothetical protein
LHERGAALDRHVDIATANVSRFIMIEGKDSMSGS